VLLDPPSMRAEPVDPRFADALVAYAAAIRALSSHRGADADEQIREALRLLAAAVALVPGPLEVREPAYRVATELRVTAARMATDFVTDRPAQTAHARLALKSLASFLLDVVARDHAATPDVLARLRAFEAAALAVDPNHLEPTRASMIGALEAVEPVLEAMLDAAISAAE
jgi:hypothetical protein